MEALQLDDKSLRQRPRNFVFTLLKQPEQHGASPDTHPLHSVPLDAAFLTEVGVIPLQEFTWITVKEEKELQKESQ